VQQDIRANMAAEVTVVVVTYNSHIASLGSSLYGKVQPSNPTLEGFTLGVKAGFLG